MVAAAIHDITPLPSATDSEYQAWRAECVVSLRSAGMEKEAAAFESCAGVNARYVWVSSKPELPPDAKSVFVCSHNPAHHAEVVRFTCHTRGCPECSRRATARLVERYLPAISKAASRISHRYRLRKITLTTPVKLTDPDIREQQKRLFKAVIATFDRILGDGWRDKQGLLVLFEYGENGHKLHFHILHYGKFIEKDELTRTWSEMTGGQCEVNYLQAVKTVGTGVQDAVQEAVKYATKFYKLDEDGKIRRFDPALMPVLFKALKGVRRVRSYGIFYELGDPERRPCLCPICEAELERWSAMDFDIFVQTGFTKDDGKPWKVPSLDLKLGNKSPPQMDRKQATNSQTQLEMTLLPKIRPAAPQKSLINPFSKAWKASSQ